MPTRVTIEDVESGDREEQLLADGDYVVVTSDPCRVDGIVAYPSTGTEVITIKGCVSREAAGQAVAGGV